MKLQDSKSLVNISFVRYEFDDSNNKEDLEWIIVDIQAMDENLHWKCTGSFIRASELKLLTEWISSINQVKIIQDRFNLTENEISFSIKQNILTVHLDMDAHPKGHNYDYQNDHEYDLKFNLNEIDLSQVVLDLNAANRKFPHRTE